ncbi:MAG: hypothetical protein P9L90_05150 [Candidatus Aadella gelida]|nr:hypothetical protein [Candidatus Aadella gelida]
MDKCKFFLITGATLSILLSGFSEEAFSESWYLINEYDITTDDSKTFRIRIVTASRNEDACYELAGTKEGSLLGGDLASTECVSGEEYEAALEGVFSSVPSEEPYVTLRDGSGNKMVIDFLSVPKESMSAFAEKIARLCAEEGFLGIKVIEKREHEEKTDLVLGLGEDDVRSIKGNPDDIIGRVWFYGKDIIIFDKNRKISDYSDFTGQLGIRS